MPHSFLTTTFTEGLQPLGTAAQRSFELVTGSVRERFGGEYAAIFGEPLAAQLGGTFDWHSGVEGTVLELASLNEDTQADVRTRLGEITRDIRSHAQQLEDSDISEDQRLGVSLLNAIEVPDKSHIFVVRDSKGKLWPILVHWAWVDQARQNVRGVLTGFAPTSRFAVARPPEVVPSVRRVWPWWLLILLGWLLLALMIATILYYMIYPCGLRDGKVFFCPEPAHSTVIEGSEVRVLEGEVAALERELARTAQTCQPDFAASEVPVTNKAELDRRLRARGGKQGDLGFSLAWNSKDDLDIEVVCPSGVKVDFRNRKACNGTLDVDANVLVEDAVADPVENVFYVDPTYGAYVIRVRLSQVRTEKPVPFTLRVTQRNGPTDSFTATVSKSGRDWKKTLEIKE